MSKKEMYIFVLIIKELEYQYTSKNSSGYISEKEFIRVIIVSCLAERCKKHQIIKNFMWQATFKI